MSDEAVPAANASFLDRLSLSETVRVAISRVTEAAGSNTPLQTGALLAALAETDTQGDWGRVWPSYEGEVDALLAASNDTRSRYSGAAWHGVPLSQDLLSALRLLALIAEKYEMDPVQPGALALALAANPCSGAALHLGELSGCSHSELLERIQSDLLGTTLDDFSEVSRRWAIQELGGRAPARHEHVLARQAGAVYCVWVAWLAVRAGVGGVIGAVIVSVAVLVSAIVIVAPRVSGRSPAGRVHQWKVELRPRYASPWFMLLLFLIGVAAVITISGRHRLPSLFAPTLSLLGCMLAIVFALGTFRIEMLVPRVASNSSTAGLSSDDFRYRRLFGTSVLLAGIVGLIVWYVRLGLLALPPPTPGTHQILSTRVLVWIRSAFITAFLGKAFDRGYWPLLVIAATAVGCYFCGLAAQLLLTRLRTKAGIWAAGSCALGLLLVAFSYSPITLGRVSTSSSNGRAVNLVIHYDEEMIDHLRDDCRAFEPATQGCPFAVAQTPDGQGGVLYAIALRATAGDSCAGSIVYFFDGEALITDTTRLPPGGMPAEAQLSSPNPGQFSVAWRVNPSANVPCVQFGTSGTDTYVYAWDGSSVILAAGGPPHPPEAFPPGSSLQRAVPDYLVRLEYCGAITVSRDGSSAPIICSDGRPSVAADRHFRQLHLRVLSLGPHATVPEIEAAVCSDVRHTNAAIASDGMQLAAAEQAWPYSALNLSEICSQSRSGTVVAKPSIRNGWEAAELPLSTFRAGSPAIACAAVDSCAAVGSFYDPSTIQPNSQGLGFPPILLGSGSSWLKAEPALLPGPAGLLFSVACPSPTRCVAVGWVSVNASQPGLLLIQSGSSVTAKAAPFPAGNQTEIVLFSVACATASSCVAVGDDNAGLGILVSGAAQRWATKIAPLPHDAARSPDVTIYYVVCPAVTSCIAVGDYKDSSGHQQGLLLSGSGSVWTATQAPMPNDAAANPEATLQSVACPSASRCLAVGNYTDSSGHSQGVVETRFGSRWTPTQAPLPAGASVAPGVGLDSVSCPSTSFCVVLGNYQDSSGNFQGLLLSPTGSAWKAIRAPLPANAASAANPTFAAVACAAVSRCTATGEYTDTSGHQQGFAVTRSGSIWSAAETPVPAGANANPSVSLSALACPAVSRCAVLGEYTDSAGRTQGLLLTQRS